MLSSHKVKAEYDRIAPYFSFGSAVTFPFRRSLYEQRILPLLGLRKGHSVLDLCCGAGHNFPYILSLIGQEGTLTGLDLSEKMLDVARSRVRRHGWNNVRLINGDAARIRELIPEYVDGVLCSLGISLMPNRLAVLHAIKDVLKPGGRVAIVEAQPFSGLAAVFNPLLYASMLPVPSNNQAIFHEAARSLEYIKQVFPNYQYAEHYSGFIYVVVA
jgi:ubiquinone/menaquinone biosynthesis C-methylase UbiE